MIRVRLKAQIPACVLVAFALSGCTGHPPPQLPQSVVGEPSVSTTEREVLPATEVVDAGELIKEIARERADAMERKSRNQFERMASISSSSDERSLRLLQTLRIDARSAQSLTASLEAIKGRLSEVDAQGFNAAVRVVMVTSLPPNLLAGQKNVTDQEIWTHILPVLDGKTPMDVLLAARARLQQLPTGVEQGQYPTN